MPRGIPYRWWASALHDLLAGDLRERLVELAHRGLPPGARLRVVERTLEQADTVHDVLVGRGQPGRVGRNGHALVRVVVADRAGAQGRAVQRPGDGGEPGQRVGPQPGPGALVARDRGLAELAQ